jgi:hypothetical protein
VFQFLKRQIGKLFNRQAPPTPKAHVWHEVGGDYRWRNMTDEELLERPERVRPQARRYLERGDRRRW